MGWKFYKYYDRGCEELSKEDKVTAFNDIVKGLKTIGLTEITRDVKNITFSRKKNENEND